MAKKQRSISVSEFFAKNKQLLGFDSPVRALLTTVKEACDNALDACEEAGILPELIVELHQQKNDRIRVCVQDNGPGIVKKQIPRIFGQLLYGSKFHSLKQSRGQQGIGISAAGMYGQLTTGRPVEIISRTDPETEAHRFQLRIDMKRNRPKVIEDNIIQWDFDHGTRVELVIEGKYMSGGHSVDEYLAQTAVANPHAAIRYLDIEGKEIFFPRVSEFLPPEAREIRPHPYGVELGFLIKLIRETKIRRISTMLKKEFSRVTAKVAREICDEADVSYKRSPYHITPDEIENIHRAIPKVKIMAPPSSAVVPIGDKLLRRGLARQVKGAEFYASTTRTPSVYKGNPFVVEVGLAYGGELQGFLLEEDYEDKYTVAGVTFDAKKTISAAMLDLPGFTRKKSSKLAKSIGVGTRTRVKNLTDDELEAIKIAYNEITRKEAKNSPAQIIRLANRVPLLYQQKACGISKAIMEMNWRRYSISQPRGGYPQGPLVIIVHLASVWVPFTSESKEAIAHYPEIIKEMKLALQVCGRDLGNYLKKKKKIKRALERKQVFKRYTSELARALSNITGKDENEIEDFIKKATEKYAGTQMEIKKPALEDELAKLRQESLPQNAALAQNNSDEDEAESEPDESEDNWKDEDGEENWDEEPDEEDWEGEDKKDEAKENQQDGSTDTVKDDKPKDSGSKKGGTMSLFD
jgi:DNA topoisomerase-6 subunit B